MTIICALKNDDLRQVWIGADSRVCAKDGGFIWPETVRKFTKCGRWMIGVSGSSRTKQLIREENGRLGAAETPAQIATIMKELYVAHEYKRLDHEGPLTFGQYLIVCDRTEVWSIYDGGIVARADEGFVAMGSGDDFAYGAWHALRGMDLGPEQIVRAALEAACAFSSDCGGELVVERVE